MAELKSRVNDALKAAMKSGDKDRVAALRLVTAAVKQYEVDERSEPDDAAMLKLLDKMAKQRRESIEQFESADREDLAARERYELSVLQEFLPEPLSDAELDGLIEAAMADTGAASMKDMGRVMGQLKPKIQGRADMAAVSARIKARLGG